MELRTELLRLVETGGILIHWLWRKRILCNYLRRSLSLESLFLVRKLGGLRLRLLTEMWEWRRIIPRVLQHQLNRIWDCRKLNQEQALLPTFVLFCNRKAPLFWLCSWRICAWGWLFLWMGNWRNGEGLIYGFRFWWCPRRWLWTVEIAVAGWI